MSPKQAQGQFGTTARVFRGWLPADPSSAVRITNEHKAFRLQCQGVCIVWLLVKAHCLQEAQVSHWRKTSPEKQVAVATAGAHNMSQLRQGPEAMHEVCEGGHGTIRWQPRIRVTAPHGMLTSTETWAAGGRPCS